LNEKEKMNSQKNQLFEQSDFQTDPGSARPEDFEVLTPEEARALDVPFNGSCGNSYREYQKLLKESASTSKGPFRGGAPRPIKNVSKGPSKPTKAVQQK
jgi:hypothetical protein